MDNNRSSAEEALRMLNGSTLGGQSIRLSWGRSPSNKQVHLIWLMNHDVLCFFVLTITLIHVNSHLQADPSQFSSGYYGYTPGYETYGYAPPPQDPNMYYAGYPGYGSYQPQQQMMQQPQVYMRT